jgi:hypothetical protein
MEPLRIPSHGVTINGIAYIAAGAGEHPAVVLLHGLPGNEKNLDLAQAIRGPVGPSSSARSVLGCLMTGLRSFTGMSNPHILHKSFHTPQPTLSAYWNIAGDD